ncbi:MULTISPECIES: DotI/IcmL family type IV secretion protein [Acidiphilium]|uniref:Macrophage killing protein with similarity to conjugation protein n=1 Tax=Acidiphilium rubrum TaxID=526 RepID=A0A8G2FHN7_ACIRU|nr:MULTISPECIES: DotI/IcmL family type IV secretion protein [Acidiphilium]SIR29717.1 Macrophage killing protein with similarity to conjugation protein [Acidiphilium rubrum]
MSDVTAERDLGVPPEAAASSRQILNPYFLLARIRSLATSNTLLAVAVAILAACQAWTLLHPRQEIFFGTSRSGNPIQLFPLNQPIYAQSRVFRFATDATDQAYSVNFVNYRHQFTRVSRKFTPAGWQAFAASFIQEHDFERMKYYDLVGSAVPTAGPSIKKEGVVGYRYTWEIQFPMLVTYRNERRHYTETRMMTVYVVRASLFHHPSGLAISQIISAPMG